MLNLALLEGDEKCIALAKEFTARYFSELPEKTEYTVDVFSDGEKFLSVADAYDIIIASVDLPAGGGMELAQAYRANGGTGCLFFVADTADMAIRGYEVGAIDYLLKPVNYRAFSAAMKRAVLYAVNNSRDRVVLASNRRILRISARDILFVESSRHKLTFHTTWGDFEDWGNISGCEEKLAPFGFLRCNSCYLINLRHIERIAGGEVIIGPWSLHISRGRKKEFVAAFLSYFDGQNG